MKQSPLIVLTICNLLLFSATGCQSSRQTVASPVWDGQIAEVENSGTTSETRVTSRPVSTSSPGGSCQSCH